MYNNNTTKNMYNNCNNSLIVFLQINTYVCIYVYIYVYVYIQKEESTYNQIKIYL